MKVQTASLEKGMIIDKDVFSKKGALLLYKGFQIENPDLVGIVLKRNDIDEVFIRNLQGEKMEVPVQESQHIRQKIEQEIQSFEKEFTEVVGLIRRDFESFSKEKDLSKLSSLDQGAKIAKEYEGSVLTLFQMIDKIRKENIDTYSRIIQNSLLAYSIGKWLDLSEHQLKEVSEAAILRGTLEESGFSYAQADIDQLKGKENISEDILQGALQSNERSDGSGPLGLSAGEIHPYAGILGVSTVYEALTGGSALGKTSSVFDAVRIMEREYMDKLDIHVLYRFLHKIGSRFIGSMVRLDDDTVGEIVFVPESEVSMPYIRQKNGHVINLQSDAYKDRHIVEIF